MMELIKQIDQKVSELSQLLSRLDPKAERDQLGLSLRLGLQLARNKAKQQRRGAEHGKPAGGGGLGTG